MTRLIDADALITAVLKNAIDYAVLYGDSEMHRLLVQVIAHQPTIDIEPQWIPCSERLPEDSGDYLVCPSDSVLEDYSDFSEIMIMPYDADCEAFGWWVERYHPISLGYLDSDFNEFEVLAWMPLPKPYEVEE